MPASNKRLQYSVGVRPPLPLTNPHPFDMIWNMLFGKCLRKIFTISNRSLLSVGSPCIAKMIFAVHPALAILEAIAVAV